MKMKATDLFNILLKGYSQVMLQNNSITGLLFLAGIFYNSWILGLGAVIGVIAGTVTAFIMKYDKNDIDAGRYGFNAVLVGIALVWIRIISHIKRRKSDMRQRSFSPVETLTIACTNLSQNKL